MVANLGIKYEQKKRKFKKLTKSNKILLKLKTFKVT